MAKRKMKTIKLEGPTRHMDNDQVGFPTHYMVVQVTDSMEYAPRQVLGPKEVVALCEAPDWKVTLVPIR